MTTRAQQFEIFAAGALYNGSVINTGYARFYAAGTTTPKNAYEDKDKSVSCTKKALDAQGRAEVFGDGIYKIQLYSGDPDDGGVARGDPIDNYKCTAVVGNVIKVTDDYTADRDDYMVLVDTTSKSITISLDDVNNFDNPIIIKKISASNTVTIDPYSTQLVDADSTTTLTLLNDTLNLAPDIETDVWRSSDIFSGVTASVDEINTVADGILATASEVNTICDADSNNPPITGDATAGRVLRVSYLKIEDATDASKVKCSLTSEWNGDTVAEVDNLTDGAASSGGFRWIDNTLIGYIIIDASVLSGNVVAVISTEIMRNYCGASHTVYGEEVGNNLWVLLYPEPTSTNLNLGTLVDTGEIYIKICYLTDE